MLRAACSDAGLVQMCLVTDEWSVSVWKEEDVQWKEALVVCPVVGDVTVREKREKLVELGHQVSYCHVQQINKCRGTNVV